MREFVYDIGDYLIVVESSMSVITMSIDGGICVSVATKIVFCNKLVPDELIHTLNLNTAYTLTRLEVGEFCNSRNYLDYTLEHINGGVSQLEKDADNDSVKRFVFGKLCRILKHVKFKVVDKDFKTNIILGNGMYNKEFDDE